MLQKYFPILEEINSPLSALVALGFTAEAVKVAVNGISNETLENLLKEAVEETATYKKEIAVSASELEAVRKSAAKAVRTLRYRAAMAARLARAVSKNSRQVKAVKRPAHKATLRGLSGLSLEDCRQKAAVAQGAVSVAAVNYNTALQAVDTAIQGGDARAIRAKVAVLKEAVRTLEVRHIEFRFAREMLAIALARHSA